MNWNVMQIIRPVTFCVEGNTGRGNINLNSLTFRRLLLSLKIFIRVTKTFQIATFEKYQFIKTYQVACFKYTENGKFQGRISSHNCKHL